MMVSELDQCGRGGIEGKLRCVKRAAIEWVKQDGSQGVVSVSDLEARVSVLEEQLVGSVVSEGERVVVVAELSSLKAELWRRARRDEKDWLQKSRLRWFA